MWGYKGVWPLALSPRVLSNGNEGFHDVDVKGDELKIYIARVERTYFERSLLEFAVCVKESCVLPFYFLNNSFRIRVLIRKRKINSSPDDERKGKKLQGRTRECMYLKDAFCARIYERKWREKNAMSRAHRIGHQELNIDEILEREENVEQKGAEE
ncbi:hypothetical protein Tco_0664155 [Tanacetum coccineum]